MITICCVCRKTKTEDDWAQIPVPQDEMVSHGYCPDCYAEQKEKIYNFFKHAHAATH